jgi:predicted 2-oxoglutarate/Fe(II)-dependent dioxygenase YbiX
MKYLYRCVENFHSPEECRMILNILEKNAFEELKDFSATGHNKFVHTKNCNIGAVRDAIEKIRHAVIDINRHSFGFTLHEVSNYESVILNQYKSEHKHEYDWHADGTLGDCFDLKITALLNLSQEPYEGGEFEIFINKPEHIKLYDKPGSLIVFPSFLYHRVKPVTKGTRLTMSQFFLGPNLT